MPRALARGYRTSGLEQVRKVAVEGTQMNGIESKGRSPFYPDQPVPVELFMGRKAQFDHLMTRAVGQVAQGKPVTVFLEGEYGIGKTSIARFVQYVAERQNGLVGIYATLDRAENLDDVGAAILEATLKTGAYNPRIGEKIRAGMAKYIGEQQLFGVTIHAEALKREAPNVTRGLLPFLKETLDKAKGDGIVGIFLVLDEINGIARHPQFASYLKGLIDSNAAISTENPSLPLLLTLCGTAERRRDLISRNESVSRIFDVVQIDKMTDEEAKEFFKKAFESVHISVDEDAIKIMIKYAAGFPKIMHLIGNSAYWLDRDNKIDKDDALMAVLDTAEEVGKRYVDQQVYQALRSKDYKSILAKIAKMGPDDLGFSRKDVVGGLTPSEKKKFDNFLRKMKSLNVISPSDSPGEYLFNVRMVRLYIWLKDQLHRTKDRSL
jgi:hypothetical protein